MLLFDGAQNIEFHRLESHIWRLGNGQEDAEYSNSVWFCSFFADPRFGASRRRGGNLYNDAIAGLREITHVAPENAIFVEKSRVVGAPDGGGPVGRLARVSPIRSFGE